MEERTHAEASIAAVKEEQALAARLAALEAQLEEANRVYAQCVTVVAVLLDDRTMLDNERRQLILVRDNPRKYGVSKTQAQKAHYRCGRELRKIKVDLTYALQAEKRALKHKDKLEDERRVIERGRKANRRAQEKLGLLPKQKRRDELPALVELAQYSGLLDGSW